MNLWSCSPVFPSTTASSPRSPVPTAYAASHCSGPRCGTTFGPTATSTSWSSSNPNTPGLLHLAVMELELEDALGRPVELRTSEDLSPYFRDQVTANARPLYAA